MNTKNNLPEFIYLQCQGKEEDSDKCSYPDCGCGDSDFGLTWCEDQINDTDVQYQKVKIKKG